ncbi:hypothetical protein SLE2022_106920 [Rubroshorea leprosula]
MKKDGVKPDTMAYTTLVMGLCKGGRVGRGFDFFKEMKGRKFLIDRTLYRVLIEGFVKDGRVGSGLDLLKDLMDSGYGADLDIYNVLIEGLCSVKQVDKAKAFSDYSSRGFGAKLCNHESPVSGFCRDEKNGCFLHVARADEETGISVLEDLSKFLFVIGKEDRTMMALEVFDDSKVKDYRSVSIYNILMEALYKIGKVKKALSLFGEIKVSNLMPDSTYRIAIMCYAEDQDIRRHAFAIIK